MTQLLNCGSDYQWQSQSVTTNQSQSVTTNHSTFKLWQSLPMTVPLSKDQSPSYFCSGLQREALPSQQWCLTFWVCSQDRQSHCLLGCAPLSAPLPPTESASLHPRLSPRHRTHSLMTLSLQQKSGIHVHLSGRCVTPHPLPNNDKILKIDKGSFPNGRRRYC